MSSTEDTSAKVYVVGGRGDYQDLQQAIDAAEDGSTIRISGGLYNANVQIDKPDLTIEGAIDEDEVTICAGQSEPAFKINLVNMNEKLTLRRLKIQGIDVLSPNIHGASKKKTRKLAFRDADSESWLESKENEDKEVVDEYLEDLYTQKNISSYLPLITLKGGHLVLDDCKLCPNLPKAREQVGLFALPKTKITGHRTDITGFKTEGSLGIYARGTSMELTRCRIGWHRKGGIVLVNHKEKEVLATEKVLITDCQINFNHLYGIFSEGKNASPILQKNKVIGNSGKGIHVGLANLAVIKGNDIKENDVGIDIQSGDPYIYFNRVFRNKSSGIRCYAYKMIPCDGVIRANEIFENLQSGIFCHGKNTAPRIVDNKAIMQNLGCGIQVDEGAHPRILKNVIYENGRQGILLVEGSSAHIEKNRIYRNIKANVALGGKNSSKTCIMYNEIYSSRSEGVFTVESEKTWVKFNKIYQNNDGIVALGSCLTVNDNTIYDNDRIGILMHCAENYPDKFTPEIKGNNISSNGVAGIMLKNGAKVIIERNKIIKNPINLASDTYEDELPNFEKCNQISGERDQGLRTCTLL